MARVGSSLASNLVAHRGQTQSALEQNLRGHRTLFAQKTQEQVFSPDMPVLEAVRFLVRVMQDAFGFGSQRQLD